MQFRCPHCNTELQSDEVAEGREVECPACGRSFAVRRTNRAKSVRLVALLAVPVVVLLCLLGVGVRSCGSSGATARRIEQALAYDGETGDRLLFHGSLFNEQIIKNLGAMSSGEAKYAAAMRSYLLSAKLPKDFKIAFLNHVSAHSELGHVADTLALEMRTTGANPDATDVWLETARRLSEEFAQASHEIDSTFDVVIRLAIQHGANIPEKIANPQPNVP